MPIEMRDELAPALTVPAGSTWLPPVTLSPAELDGHRPRVAVDSQGAAVVVWLSRDPGPDGTDRVRAAFRAPGGSFGQTNPILDADNGQPTPQIPILQVARDSQGNTLIVWTRSFGTSTSDRVQAAFIPADDQSAVADLISEDGQEADSPQVAFGRGGDALVVWRSHDGTNSRIQAAFRPAGDRFGAPQTISDPAQDAFAPQITFDRAGNTLAVWTRFDGTNRRVQAAFCPAGDRFGQAQTISDPGQDAGFPRIAVNAQGTALAIWDRFDGTHRRVQAAFRPPGGRFGVAQTISAAGQDGFDPRVVFDSLGNATAVWEHSDGTNTRVQAAFRPAGGSFGPAQTISAAGVNGTPQLAVDGQGNAVAVWEHADGPDSRVQAAVRPAGRPFRAPETISEGGGDTSEPQIAIDGRGNPTVVWQHTQGTNRRIQAAFRTPAQTISPAGQDAVRPRIAVNAQGSATVVWERFEGSTNVRVDAAFRAAGGSFGPPQTISPLGQSGLLQVAVDAQGNTLIVWTDGRVLASFRPAGGSFGPPQSISPPGQGVGLPRVAVNPQGDAAAVWERLDGTNDRVQAAFRPAGGNFGPPQTISAAVPSAGVPEVAVDSQGNTVAIWTRLVGTNNRLEAAFRPAGGNFGQPQTISPDSDNAGSPEVVLDGQGNAIAIWTRRVDTNSRVEAAFRPAGGNFGPPQTISPAGQSAFSPNVAVDSLGNAIAVWTRSDGTNSRVQAAFRPAGGSFGPPQTISPVGHNAYSARIVFDSQGNALGFWESDNTTENRIRVAFRPAGGTFGPPQAISAAGQFAYSPQVAFESQGSSIALWSHFDGTNRVVQAAFGAAGGSFGPPQTISGASLPGEPDLGDLEPRLAVDSQGNAIAVWRRFDGTHSRVQAAFRPVGGNFGPP